jgi:hypothetical protein
MGAFMSDMVFTNERTHTSGAFPDAERFLVLLV